MYWQPPLAPRGLEVWDTPYRFTLVEGARRSGKSISICHKILRHAVQWDGAEVCLLTKYLKKGEAGIWRDLVRRKGIVDQWVEAGLTRYTKPPSYAMASKMPYFRLRTANGGEAEIQLHGLENDQEAEDKFKDSRFSLVYLNEADSFEDRIVFDTLRQQLRSMAIPNQYLSMILDTNPPEKGKKHWLYKLFFANPNPQFGRVHFSVDDNPFLTPEEKADLFNNYEYDKALLDRYYHGIWGEATVNSVFSDVFLPSMHIVGEEFPGPLPVEDELDGQEILRPYDATYTLECGWDLGDRASVVSFGCARPYGSTVGVDLIDEVVVLNDRIGLDEFVHRVMERMAYWDRWVRSTNGLERVIWRHWSDTSSLRHKMNIGMTEAAMVRNLSGGRIHLLGVEKGAGSVSRRLQLMKRLLFESRLWISPLCRKTIEMFRSLPSGSGTVIDVDSPHKHTFDAASYMVGATIPMELNLRRLGVSEFRSATMA